uniref:S-acyltransferase n=1 Tax=Kalanchoe fedtschenkoi TaxID=63787 RepID=A0A7N0T438_KALFE
MGCNLFKFCSGLRVLGYFMILLVAAIVAMSYYAVVVITWGPRLLLGGSDSALSLSIVLVFHILLVLLMWSYFRVVFEDPGSVPENWKPLEENLEGGAGSSLANDYVAPGTSDSIWPSGEIFERPPTVGYCSRCQNGKPPRCHHCSICQRCVLKMDHHCIWVVNCVGAHNYKFFLLFLFYTFLETTLDCIVLLPKFINFFSEAKNGSVSPGNLAATFLAFVLNLAFALSLLGFIIMNTSLLLSNTTSVEVFGTKKALWFFPLISKEDFDSIPALKGLDFPMRSDVEG